MFYLSQVYSNTTYINNSYFQQNSGIQAQLLYLSTSLINYLTFNNSVFTNEVQQWEKVQNEIITNLVAMQTPSMIEILQSTNIIFQNCDISNFHYALSGAFASLTRQSELTMINTTVSYLSSSRGGAFVVGTQSSLSIINSIFSKNGAISSGVFEIEGGSQLNIQGSLFTENFAQSYAVFKILGNSNIAVSDSNFVSNIAEISGSVGGVVQLSNTQQFTNCLFENNQAFFTPQSTGGKMIDIIVCTGNILFTQCQFINNEAMTFTPNIYAMGSTLVSFDSCLFKQKDLTAQGNIYGTFINAIAKSTIYIIDSTLTGGVAMQGGAVFLLGESNLFVSSSTFSNNVALLSGGAIYGVSFDTVSIDSNTQFLNNRAINLTADSIFLQKSSGSVTIDNTTLYSNIASNFIDFSIIPSLSIQNSIVSIDHSQTDIATNKTNAISIINVNQLSIVNSTFQNLKGNSISGGGALYISVEPQYKASTNTFTISGSKFINNTNLIGGAISISDTENFVIDKGTKFIGNAASQSGGAIAFNCQKYGSDLTQCSLLLNNSVLENNTAGVEGGAIQWNVYEPDMLNTSLINNSAGVYGDDIASVPKYILLIPNSLVDQKNILEQQSSRRLDALQSLVNDVQSGGSISMNFAIVDKYGTIVRTDHSSKLILSPVQNPDAKFASLITSASQFIAAKGIFQVNDFSMVGDPNQTHSINITTDSIDQTIPDNQNKQGLLAIYANQSLSLTLNFRPCLTGETMEATGACTICQKSTYLLEAPTIPTSCLPCPPGPVADCPGGDILFPLPGYWRSGIYTDSILQCRNEEACLGQNGGMNDQMGMCYEGYSGILCSDCKIGYSRSGNDYKCAVCPSPGDNAGRLLGILIALILAIIFIVRSNITSTPKKPDYLSAFFRILMNHFQVLVIISGYDLQWPPQMQQFFSSTKPVTEISQQFLSMDCYFDQRSPVNGNLTQTYLSITGVNVTYESYSEEYEESSDIHRVFFKKIIMYAILPFFIIIMSYLAWMAIFFFQGYGENKQISGTVAHFINRLITRCSRQNKEVVSMSPLDKSQTSKLSSQLSINSEQSQKTETLRKVGRVITTIIIILFLLHPNITKIMFSAFKCQSIDGVGRLYEDLQVVCYSHSHNLIAYIFALPAIVVWGIGIPTFALFVIIFNRKQLDTLYVRNMYGFLYNGYKRRTFYWEFVIIYRKIIMIFIQIFIAQLGKIVQAMVLLIFLAANVSYHGIQQPFINHQLNNLETISLLSQCITIYCGVFYIANNQFKTGSDFDLTDNSLTFFFSMIIIFNTLFWVYWVVFFIYEIRLTIRKKAPKLYLLLFLCSKQDKLNVELGVDEIKDLLDPFIQDIELAKIYINERKKMYLAGKIPIEDEGLKQLLKERRIIQKSLKVIVDASNADTQFVKIDELVRMKTMAANSKQFDLKRTQTKLLKHNELVKGQNGSEEESSYDEGGGPAEAKTVDEKNYDNFAKSFKMEKNREKKTKDRISKLNDSMVVGVGPQTISRASFNPSHKFDEAFGVHASSKRPVNDSTVYPDLNETGELGELIARNRVDQSFTVGKVSYAQGNDEVKYDTDDDTQRGNVKENNLKHQADQAKKPERYNLEQLQSQVTEENEVPITSKEEIQKKEASKSSSLNELLDKIENTKQ